MITASAAVTPSRRTSERTIQWHADGNSRISKDYVPECDPRDSAGPATLDPGSFLNWMERMTRLRLRSPEFGTSRCEWLDASDPAVLAHCCRGEKSSVLAVHNLSGREVETTIELGRNIEGLFDLLNNCEDHVDGDGRHRVRLGPYGYQWLREGRGLESLAGAID